MNFTTCLVITNYNYAHFITDAVVSAFSQTKPFDRVIVVDDASTDDSVDVIRVLSENYPDLVLLQQTTNLGQLAAFQLGVRNSTEDVVFFLDADDVISPDHCAVLSKVIEGTPNVEFVFSRFQLFFGSDAPEFARESTGEPGLCDDHLGSNFLEALYARQFLGAPTSCLAMRRRIAAFAVEVPDEFLCSWRTRADDCLVFGADLLGAQKVRVNKTTVGYRSHGANVHLGSTTAGSASRVFERELSLQRLFGFFLSKQHLRRDGLTNAHLAFKTKRKPSFQQLLLYARCVIAMGTVSNSRLRALAVILKHFYKARVDS